MGNCPSSKVRLKATFDYVLLIWVREHLYRLHALPIRCSRCCTVFTSETLLEEHYRLPDICPINLLDIEGSNKDQEMKLRSRKKSPAASEAEKWKATYRILFPDDEEDLIPSPCAFSCSEMLCFC